MVRYVLAGQFYVLSGDGARHRLDFYEMLVPLEGGHPVWKVHSVVVEASFVELVDGCDELFGPADLDHV